MSVLWVKAGGVLPADSGGRIRSLRLLEQLAGQTTVAYFGYGERGEAAPHEPLKGQGIAVDYVELDLPAKTGLTGKVDFAKSLLSGRPYTMWRYNKAIVRERLAERVDTLKPKVVVCDFTQPTEIMPWGSGPAFVVFTHNVESLIWKRHAETAKSPLWRWAYQTEGRRLERAERELLPRADRILAVSDSDQAIMQSIASERPIHVIPTGVDVGFFAESQQLAARKPDEIVFTGSMDWPPNSSAMRWFVREIFPLIQKRRPGAHLSIVGRRPSAAVKALAGDHVTVTGSVDDIRPYLGAGSVYIVPIRSGSGTRIKIYEAMAAGIPVVTTTIGAEGLPLEPDTHARYADDAQAFANAVCTVLEDRSAALAMAERARGFVRANFDWPEVGKAFAQAVLDR